MNLGFPDMDSIDDTTFQTTEQRIKTMLGLLKVHTGLHKVTPKKTKINVVQKKQFLSPS